MKKSGVKIKGIPKMNLKSSGNGKIALLDQKSVNSLHLYFWKTTIWMPDNDVTKNRKVYLEFQIHWNYPLKVKIKTIYDKNWNYITTKPILQELPKKVL